VTSDAFSGVLSASGLMLPFHQISQFNRKRLYLQLGNQGYGKDSFPGQPYEPLNP
jgi:hypothetical protein